MLFYLNERLDGRFVAYAEGARSCATLGAAMTIREEVLELLRTDPALREDVRRQLLT